MKIAQAGIALIQSFETCRLQAYKPTPDDQWTCGWGHCGADVDATTLWTQEQADAAFLADIAWVERCVNKSVTASVNQNEFDALCSLCFNIGCTAFGKSTLVKELNRANFGAAAEQFKVWNRQNHKELAGLTRRRQAEADLFETEVV